jgi:hypothetical protein
MDDEVTEPETAGQGLAETTGSGPDKPPAEKAANRGQISRREQFYADVFGFRRSVQPLAGWFLSGLLGLVVWLTVVYAPGAFQRANLLHGADPKGVITVEAGYFTVAAVTLIALFVAFEPVLSRVVDDYIRSSHWRWLGRSPAYVRLPVLAVGTIISLLWQLPSIILSFLDYLLARPVAVLVGITQKDVARRYGWAAVLMLAVVAAGLFAPPPWGLYAVCAGLIAVFAIVRRWSWSEADRETFLVERGMRKGAMRVGFAEDLRDEALIAISCLFVLFPIGLRQIQLATCAANACAFTLDGDAALPPDLLGQFLAWLGYFGAELAKAVPFVDWSEVFHVANDSPIKPQTAFGAQIIFAMRAALDLLLLAAVLQAMQIAGRLKDQSIAFKASRLPILEPFAEAKELRRAALRIEPVLEIQPTQQYAVSSFPAYEETRLKEIISPRESNTDPLVRNAAVALLASQHASEVTDHFFTEQAKAEPDADMRDWIIHVACAVTRERNYADHDADRARLKALLEDRFEELPVRTAAARRLGRIPAASATTALLQECLADRREGVEVRAAAVVALSKIPVRESHSGAESLIGSFKGQLHGDALIAAMATAYALARLAGHGEAETIAKAFDAPIREHALRATLVQPEPTTIEAAKAREPGILLNQLVRILPGEAPFKATFTMGSGDEDDQAFDSERPPTKITMTEHYAIGRYAVTQEEYLGFCLATGRPPLQYAVNRRWPALEVSWLDSMNYCLWLEAITGERYRLLSEVEWEYACRAGTETRYSWGDRWDDAKANSNRTQPIGPREVGTYDPNNWGLWDMHGNAFEWCADPWHQSGEGRPLGQGIWSANGEYGRRVVRGGSWNTFPQRLRSALRGRDTTDARYYDFGFRLARTLDR